MKTLGLFSLLTLLAGTKVMACAVNDIDMASEDDSAKYTIVSEKPAHFRNAAQFNRDMGIMRKTVSGFEDCKDSMLWRVIKDNQSGKVFLVLMSDEDDCDGGNSQGVLFLHHHRIGTINDSVITCK